MSSSALEGRGSSASPEEAPLAAAIRRFQEGTDREASFRLVYETYFQPLVRFFRRKGVDTEDAFDLTQETLLRIYKGLDEYEDRQRFAAWVFRIATTTFLKHRRRFATAKRSAIEISRDAMEHPEPLSAQPDRQLDTLIDGERRQALRREVAELPDQMRDCLVLRLYHGLAYREIAKIKQVSVETVKAHLFRARKRLRETLGSEDDLEI